VSKKNRNRRRPQRRNSPLSAHTRHRSKLTPPLTNIAGGALKTVHWERDDLPDFLIVVRYLSERGSASAVDRLHALLDVIDARLGTGSPNSQAAVALPGNGAAESKTTGDAAQPDGVDDASSATPEQGAPQQDSEQAPPEMHVFAGRLTDFDHIDDEKRRDLLAALLHGGLYEQLIPEELAHVLSMYPDAPASWLLQPWRDRGLTVDPVVAERVLNDLLVAAGPSRGDVATWAKALVCRRHLAAGRTHLPSKEMWDHYTGWPNHEDERQNRAAEAGYRAMYSAFAHFDESSIDRRRGWAKTFWHSNWRIYACRWPNEDLAFDVAAADIEADEAEGEPGAEKEMGEDAEALTEPADFWRQTVTTARKVVDELRSDFQKLAETADPDLYDPDRYEVLTGLVGRVLRYLGVFAGYPPLWTMEHGAPLLRTLVETRIVFRYIERSGDPDISSKFKAYGIGRLKLLKLHYEDVIDKTENPSPDFVAYVGYLDALVNQDVMEEFQDIDLGGNFAGADTRKMAQAVGLEDEYRLVFAPASANVHGEWSIMDEYVFDRCENPAHRRHRILRRTRDSAVGPNFLQTLIHHAAELVEEYEAATEEQRKIV